MLPELIKKTNLFLLLLRIDIDLADQTRKQRCPYCNSPLHQANYKRKPWDVPKGIPDEQLIRQSLCCGREGCRKRAKPPSCIFWGKKKYWSGIILVAMALRQNRPEGASTKKLIKIFGISRETLSRWICWFRDEFPVSKQWKRIRGRISASIRSDRLPGDLLDYFICNCGSHEDAFVGCLQFLASGMEKNNHKKQGSICLTQKL